MIAVADEARCRCGRKRDPPGVLATACGSLSGQDFMLVSAFIFDGRDPLGGSFSVASGIESRRRMQKLPRADLTRNLALLFCRHRRGWCGHISLKPGPRNPPEGRVKPNMSEYSSRQIIALQKAAATSLKATRELTVAVDVAVQTIGDLASGVQPPKPPVPPQPVPPPPPVVMAKILKAQAAELLKAAGLLDKAFKTKGR